MASFEPDRWRQTVEDGRQFLTQWGQQAAALGWTARDLFGLHEVPQMPHVSYRRLARYDCTGLCWLLRGREVVALTRIRCRHSASERQHHHISPLQRAGAQAGGQSEAKAPDGAQDRSEFVTRQKHQGDHGSGGRSN